MGSPPVANFDSATAMLRARARSLHGKDFPALGSPRIMGRLAGMIDLLGDRAREWLYTWSGWLEAIPPDRLGRVNAEAIARWMVDFYPRRQYPAAMIGSSNGAAVHLCAALGIPWLPQTYLIPGRQSWARPDEPIKDMEGAQGPARALLEASPDLQLHHMHDANQDRLMIAHMTYFRVKRLRLGAAYEQFLMETLPEGATILLLECQRTWPTTQLGERYFFQHGALGGATTEEYLRGSKRVEDYLRRYHSPYQRWASPVPDGEQAEAEWGFASALRADVERFARQRGYRVQRILFTEPEDSARWWRTSLAGGTRSATCTPTARWWSPSFCWNPTGRCGRVRRPSGCCSTPKARLHRWNAIWSAPRPIREPFWNLHVWPAPLNTWKTPVLGWQ